MIVYQTRPDGVFVGCVVADESPLEPGVYHIPGLCIVEEPPEFGEGYLARWDGEKWNIEEVPEIDPVETLRDFLDANPSVAKLLTTPKKPLEENNE